MLAQNTVLQGRYTVLRLLGQGGMGAVYLADDNRFKGRYVALKETLVDRSREDLRRQFEREALLLFDLKHQALPKVIDYFAEGDGEFLVMEFVEGEDLAHVLSRNRAPLPVDQILAWGTQLLDALAYLHEQDPPVIHRDIKPQNVKLTPKGQLVLLDFGLAKGRLNLQTTATAASIVAGTPAFAPLEQMNGQGTDVRSDIYGVAATLYTLLAAAPPLDAGVRAAEILNGRPDPLVPLTAQNPAVPESVWHVIRDGLAMARDARPPSAVAFRDALRAAAGGAAAPLPPLPTTAGPPATIAFGALPPRTDTTVPGTTIGVSQTPTTPAGPGTTQPEMFRTAVGQEPAGRRIALWATVAVVAVVAVVALLGWGLGGGTMQPNGGEDQRLTESSAPTERGTTPGAAETSESDEPGADRGGKAPTPPAETAGDREREPSRSEPAATPSDRDAASSSPPPPPKQDAGTASPPKVTRLSGGVLAGKAISRPQPSYPAMARAAGAEGAVVVEVKIDESGNVVSARALTGHPLLRDAAVKAAYGWRFSPTELSGVPVKVIGTITFNFRMN